MKIVKKLKKVLALSDPYPNIGYEILCYVKAAFGLTLFILGLFLILSPVLKSGLVILGFSPILGLLGEKVLCWQTKTFGENFTIASLIIGISSISLGFYFFWKIKLVRKLVKIIFT